MNIQMIHVIAIAATSAALFAQGCQGNRGPTSESAGAATTKVDPGQLSARAKRLVGTKARPFTVDSIEGDEFCLDDADGEILVIDFWNIGCAACLSDMPVMQEVSDWIDRNDLPARAITIHTTDGRRNSRLIDSIRDYTSRNKITVPILLDREDSEFRANYAVESWPRIVVIGPDGTIEHVMTTFGSWNKNQLEEAISRLSAAD